MKTNVLAVNDRLVLGIECASFLMSQVHYGKSQKINWRGEAWAQCPLRRSCFSADITIKYNIALFRVLQTYRTSRAPQSRG